MPTGRACGAEVLRWSISHRRVVSFRVPMPSRSCSLQAASCARLSPCPSGQGCCGLEDHPRGPSADQSKARTS